MITKSRRTWVRSVMLVTLLTVIGLLAGAASGCGSSGAEYVGAWLQSPEQTRGMRITEGNDRLLVEVLDLTQATGQQTLFTTEVTAQEDGSLKLSYESANGEVVEGGSLVLSADGSSLSWTDSTGAQRGFSKVTVLPSAAPSP